MAKITRFGTITEDSEGDLVLDGFSFDMEHGSAGDAPELLQLVIDRLNFHLQSDEHSVEEI